MHCLATEVLSEIENEMRCYSLCKKNERKNSQIIMKTHPILPFQCVPTVRLDDPNYLSSMYEGKYHQEVHPCYKEIFMKSRFLNSAVLLKWRTEGGGDSFQFPRQNVFEVHGGLYTVSLRDTALSRFVLYKWYRLQNIFIYTA